MQQALALCACPPLAVAVAAACRPAKQARWAPEPFRASRNRQRRKLPLAPTKPFPCAVCRPAPRSAASQRYRARLPPIRQAPPPSARLARFVLSSAMSAGCWNREL